MRAFAGSRLLLALALFLLSSGAMIRAGTFTQDLFPIASTIETGRSSILLTPDAAFTAGNIVVCRIGDGSSPLGNGATPVFLDEYDSAGNRLQSIAMPTTASGSNLVLTASGTASSECQITRSADGRYILVTGYNATIPTASVASSGVARVIGRVSPTGTVDTTTSTTSLTQTIRGAASDNGTNLWAVGDANGVVFKTFGTSGTGTIVSTTITNNRAINIFDGQLYTSDSSGSAVRLGKVGTGMPTTNGQTITNLPGFPTSGGPNAFYFADLTTSVSGSDTLYVASDFTVASPPTSISGGLKKFSLVSGSWVYNGTFPASTTPSIPASSFTGLAGSTDAGIVTLYATRSGSQLVSFVDSTGYDAAPTAVPTLVAVPDTNMVFRGVVFAPVLPPASQPNATNLSASETYTEDTPLNLTDIVVTDADSASVTATLALSATAAGSLSTATSGSTTSTYVTGTGVWTAAGPIAEVNDLLAGVVFTPSLNFNSNFTIATSVSDGITSPVTGSKAITGSPINDAPVLDATKNPTLLEVQEDASAPAGAVGTPVSNLVDFAIPAGQVDNVTDPDSAALLGIAVTDADTTNGSWFYSTDSGTNWLPLGSVSDLSARLLAADAASRLYFLPNAGYFGQASITFRAWDQTVGTNGGLQSATPNGGSTAFSSASDTADVTVNPGTPSVQFGSAIYSGPEGFAAMITVTRTGDLSDASSVDWSTSGSGGGACDTVGVDYESASGALTFAADEATKTFTVQLCNDHDSDNGESVSLDLENAQGSTLGTTASATLQILDAAAQFTNMQTLTIGTGGTSSPYGTPIIVSGSTSISGVKLTLFGVNYANPDDLDVLLVGPHGEAFIPVADVGGSSPLVNATVTLEDNTLIQLPDGSSISDGQNYRPAVCTVSGTVDDFPAPAPGGSYSQPGCTTAASTFASVFGNIDSNGTWTLYVRDDNGDPIRAGAVGGSIGGWGIQLLAPTAAEVTVSGRVRTPLGMGIRGAVVTITGGHLSQPVMAVTNSFGYYRMENVPAGASYVVTVQSRRYAFSQPSRMLNVQDGVVEVDFISVW